MREAAEGRSQAALRAMQRETDIRIDPFQRADRFVEGWQQLQRHREEMLRDGDHRGAKRVAQDMAGMAKSLERDPQLESLLANRKAELGIGMTSGRSLGGALAFRHGLDLGRGRGLGI